MFPDRFAFGEALAELRNVVRSEVLKLFRSNLHENVVARGKAELDMLKSQFRREVGAASEKRSQWHPDSLNLTDSIQVRNPSGKNGPGTMFLVMFTHLELKRVAPTALRKQPRFSSARKFRHPAIVPQHSPLCSQMPSSGC